MKTCLKCGSEFDSKHKNKLYCSHGCYERAKAQRHYSRVGTWLSKKEQEKDWECEKCGASYHPTRKDQRYCSSKCSGDSRRRFLSIPDCLEEASRKLDKKIGYVRVYCPMHPDANTWGYVYEHRLIMESIIGRHLTKQEHVHHINGKRWDNTPENLQIMSPSEHSRVPKKSS